MGVPPACLPICYSSFGLSAPDLVKREANNYFRQTRDDAAKYAGGFHDPPKQPIISGEILLESPKEATITLRFDAATEEAQAITADSFSPEP